MARAKDQMPGWRWDPGFNPETSTNPMAMGLHNKEMPKEGNFDVKRDYGSKGNFAKQMEKDGKAAIAARQNNTAVAEKPTGAQAPSQLGTSDKPPAAEAQPKQTYELSNNQKATRLKPAAGSYRPPEAQRAKDTLG